MCYLKSIMTMTIGIVGDFISSEFLMILFVEGPRLYTRMVLYISLLHTLCQETVLKINSRLRHLLQEDTWLLCFYLFYIRDLSSGKTDHLLYLFWYYFHRTTSTIPLSVRTLCDLLCPWIDPRLCPQGLFYLRSL